MIAAFVFIVFSGLKDSQLHQEVVVHKQFRYQSVQTFADGCADVIAFRVHPAKDGVLLGIAALVVQAELAANEYLQTIGSFFNLHFQQFTLQPQIAFIFCQIGF